MATNIKVEKADTVCIALAGAAANDPVAVGFITGVALAAADTNNLVVVKIKPSFVASMSVQALATVGSAGSGSAVALGDKLYKDSSSTVISKDTSGKLWGYALGTYDTAKGGYPAGSAVLSGATKTIDVLLA